MSSSIFFRSRSQKEPSQITFDGASLSVFEVKRDIMTINKLGNGKDFDLHIYNKDTNEEYDDDTEQIPRQTTVIVSRRPAAKNGAGRAARYVSGQMPVSAKNAHRIEATSTTSSKAGPTLGNSKPESEMTEEEKLKRVFAASKEQWKEDQAQIAKAPVMRSTHNKPAPVPDKPLPPGYTCHRCGEKGHWIQACPTNNDPNFDGRPKFRRTTGIPKSFLKVVEKPAGVGEDGKVDVSKLPPGVMYTATGEWVIAEPDKASWDKFQEKSKAAAEQAKEMQKDNQEIRDRGLECSIDQRLFVNPHKTPCCGETYCFDCIENHLVNSDFVCPNCGEQALLDDLKPDEDMAKKVIDYESEKKTEKAQKDKESTASPTAAHGTPLPETNGSKSPAASGPAITVDAPESTGGTPQSAKSIPRKRSADGDLPNEHKPAGPAEMNKSNSNQGSKTASPLPPAAPKAMQQQQQQQQQQQNNQQGMPSNMPDFIKQMNAMAGSMPGMQNGMPAFNNPMMGMPMNPMMGMMNPMMMNPMMMGGMGGMNPMGGFPNPQQAFGNGGWQNPQQNWTGPNQMRAGSASAGGGGGNDGAYMRNPVNPHRQQGRQRRQRSVDYKQMGQ